MKTAAAWRLSWCGACRNPRQYFKIFDDIEMREKDGRYAHFELLSCKPVDAYCRIKKNQNQVHACSCPCLKSGNFLYMFP